MNAPISPARAGRRRHIAKQAHCCSQRECEGGHLPLHNLSQDGSPNLGRVYPGPVYPGPGYTREQSISGTRYLHNVASGPEIGIPGRISTGF